MVAKEVESVFHVERVFTIIRVSAIDSRGMLLLLIAIPRLVTWEPLSRTLALRQGRQTSQWDFEFCYWESHIRKKMFHPQWHSKVGLRALNSSLLSDLLEAESTCVYIALLWWILRSLAYHMITIKKNLPSHRGKHHNGFSFHFQCSVTGPHPAPYIDYYLAFCSDDLLMKHNWTTYQQITPMYTWEMKMELPVSSIFIVWIQCLGQNASPGTN